MRTHAEWKVDTHIPRATPPTRRATRSFISSAALLVKVIARIAKGETPRSRIRWATRYVSTRVLPEPAPATTSTGPSVTATASRCDGFSSSKSDDSGTRGSVEGDSHANGMSVIRSSVFSRQSSARNRLDRPVRGNPTRV